MMSLMRGGIWRVLIITLALALPVAADTLELKGGRVVNGRYMGGTQTQVRFQVGGKIELYPVEDIVDSSKNKVGDRFRASLEQDLMVGDTLVAPKGTDVYGRLAQASEAGKIAGRSELKLELTDILINQQLQPIMSGDYEVSGKSRGSDSAKKIGGGAALGAVIGAIAGGGKGAAIGAGVGAGAGT